MRHDVTGFQWDAGNADKNWIRHRVSQPECEQVFLNEPLVLRQDWRHSEHKDRHLALGKTDSGRLLFVVLVFRGELIRVISARDMTPRERRSYEHATKESIETNPDL